MRPPDQIINGAIKPTDEVARTLSEIEENTFGKRVIDQLRDAGYIIVQKPTLRVGHLLDENSEDLMFDLHEIGISGLVDDEVVSNTRTISEAELVSGPPKLMKFVADELAHEWLTHLGFALGVLDKSTDSRPY